MQIKRLAALSLAAIFTAAMLTGCDLLAWLAWLEENSDSSSVTSSPSSSTSRPSYDDEDDDTGNTGDTGGEDTETPDDPNKPTVTLKNNELTVAGGDGALTTDALKELLPEGTNKAMIATLDLSNSGYTSIGVSTFSECTGLTSVKLPESLTSIGEYAFLNCTSLTSIELPDSLTSIGTAAFQGTSLISIRVGTGIINSDATIGRDAFDIFSEGVTVYYPSEWDADADKDDKLKAVQAKLASGGLQTNLSNYQPGNGEYTQPTQASPEVPDSAKKLLDTVRAFGM